MLFQKTIAISERDQFKQEFKQIMDGLHSKWPHFLAKWLFDKSISATVLLLSLPLQLLIMATIRLTSDGPAIFKQQRIGYHGRPFMLYKYRSMTANPNDRQKVTWVGRYLRISKLDELPQLFNVFKGDMSLVGPRPLLFPDLSFASPFFLKRHLVKPGLTGEFQITTIGTDFRKSYLDHSYLDLHYIKYFSFGRDLQLLYGTTTMLWFLLKTIYHNGFGKSATIEFDEL